MPASLISHPSIGNEDEEGCIFKGETCQKSGGFHQLGRCAREGRESGVRSDFADLPLCFAFPVAVSLEGQMTLSRRLLLMKTTRFLAGPFNNCAHPGIGAARDKSPDPRLPLSPDPLLPCLATRVLLRRPSATDSHRVYCSTYGNRAASACLAAHRG